MANKIILKKSSVTTKIPLVTDLDYGELALNYADGRLYFKTDTNEIKYFTTPSNAAVVVPISTTPPSLPSSGSIWWDSQSGNLKIYYDDGTSSQWVDAFASVPNASTTGGGTDTNTTYTLTAVVSGSGAILRLTDSNAVTNDVTILSGSNISVATTGTNIVTISTTSDMTKSVYDTDADGKVDSAEVADSALSVDWSGVTNAPSFTTLTDVANATGDIHGIVDRTASTISFNEGTRTFTITPVSASWTFYNHGTLYTVVSAKSITIANTSGARFIKIDPATLNLVEGGSVPDFAADVIIAYIYWNATTSECIILGDERHGYKRDTTWHSNQHLNVGTVWRSGGALSYTLNDANTVQVGVGTPLLIADEDLLHTITHSATPSADYQQILNTAASLEVLYLSGTNYTSVAASTTPWIAGTSLARYNLVSGGSGSLVDASEGSYITYWLLATNDTRSPVKLVLGRAAHATLDAAYAETFEEYGLSFAEQVFMQQIVVRTSASYTANAAKIVIAGVRKVLSKLATTASTVSATEHNSLTGRDIADAHTISSVTGLQTALNSKQDTLVSGTSIKTINSTSVLGSGNIVTPNTTYAISAATTTGGANLSLTGSDSSTDNVKFAQSNFATVTQTDANTITIGTTYNITVGTSAPASPNIGDLWVDTN